MINAHAPSREPVPLLQCLYHVCLEEFEEKWRDRLLHTIIFKRVLEIIRIKISHLLIKGENNWEGSEVSM